MSVWVLLLLASITFLNRYAFLSSRVSYTPGAQLRKFLSYASHAVLTAIWTPIVFRYSPGQFVQITGIDYLLAASIAIVLTAAGVRSILVVLVSTASFFLLRFGILA